MSSPEPVRLRAAALTADAAPVVVSAPQVPLDDRTRALVEDAHARGVAEGRDAGRAAARRELQSAADTLRDGLVTAVDRLAAEVRAQHDELATALERRVLAAVRLVLGHEPTDGARVADALVRAVAAVRSPRLEVRVPAAHEELVRAALAEVVEVEVVVDDRLGPDDARVLAADVQVDLRRERLLTELAAVLDEGAPLAPLGDDAARTTSGAGAPHA